MLPRKLFTPKCLHPDRDIVFRDDLVNFYEFILTHLESSVTQNKTESSMINTLDYAKFKSLWKERNMSMLHFSKTKEENSKEYYEVLFGEIQQFFLLKNQLRPDMENLFKLISVYFLYSLYYTQINKYPYQINTIPEVLTEINTLIDKLVEKDINPNIIHALYQMVNRLYQDEAFSIGAIIGLKTIMLNKYGLPLEQKTNVYRDYLDIKTNYSSMMKDPSMTDMVHLSDIECNMNYNQLKKSAIDTIKLITDHSMFNRHLYSNVINTQISHLVNMDNLLIQDEDFAKGQVTNLDMQFFLAENNIFNK